MKRFYFTNKSRNLNTGRILTVGFGFAVTLFRTF